MSITQQVHPRVALTGGFYRRDFQNQTITRNVAVDPVADYTTYNIVGPSDPRLPNGGGEIIPRFNLLAAKNGLVDNVSTFSTLNTASVQRVRGQRQRQAPARRIHVRRDHDRAHRHQRLRSGQHQSGYAPLLREQPALPDAV